MSDAVAVHLDKPYAQQDETRAAARAAIQRRLGDDADEVLAMLGLIDEDPNAQDFYLGVNGRAYCTRCRKMIQNEALVCRRMVCTTGAKRK